MINKKFNIFKIIWFGQLISILGSNLTTFTLGVWIFNTTGKTTPFAISILLAILPYILFSPFAGIIADKYNKKNVIIISDTLSAITTFILILIVYNNYLTIINVFIIIFMNSTFNVFQSPSYQASIVILVPKKFLNKANGMNQITLSLQNLLPPLIAGFLYLLIGINGIIIIDIVTFFVAFLTIIFIPKNNFESLNSQIEEKNNSSILKNFKEGYNFVKSRKALLALIILSSMTNFFINFENVLLTPLILSNDNTTKLGIIQSIGGIGMLIGSFCVTYVNLKFKLVNKIYLALVFSSFSLILIGLKSNLYSIGLGYFLFLFFIPLASSSSNIIWQLKVPKNMQGRVFALRQMLIRILMPFSYILTGILTDKILKSLLEKNYIIIDFLFHLLGKTSDIIYRVNYIIAGIGLLFTVLTVSNYKPFKNIEQLPNYK